VEEAVLLGQLLGARERLQLGPQQLAAARALEVLDQVVVGAPAELVAEEAAAPQVADARVGLAERGLDGGQALLLRVYVLAGVRRGARQLAQGRDHGVARLREGVLVEEQLALLGHGLLVGWGRQSGDLGTDQRVAAAQVVVEEGEWLSLRYRLQPQRELRQLDGQRVQVHAVDAALDHQPPGRDHVGLFVRRLRAQVGEVHDGLAHAIRGGAALDQVVREEVRGLDQEVPAAHGRVEHRQLQDLRGPFAPLDQRPQRVLDDVLDDELRRVVRAGGLALAAVGDQIQVAGLAALLGVLAGSLRGRPQVAALAAHDGHRPIGLGQAVLQQALVDAAEVAHAQVAEVHAGALVGARQQLEHARRPPVRHSALFEERMALGVEEAAVVGRDTEPRVPLVDHLEEATQARPECRHAIQELVSVLVNLALDGVQRVALAVALILPQGQQVAGFGVEDEEQPIQEDQGVVVDGPQTLFREVPGLLSLGEASTGLQQRPVDAVAHVLAQPLGGEVRLGLHALQEGDALSVRQERRAPEEQPEVGEGVGVGGLQQRRQVHLVEDVQARARVTAVEPPLTTVREDGPAAASLGEVVEDLEAGVLEVPRVATGQRSVELTIPSLCVAHSQGVAPVLRAAILLGLSAVAGRFIGEEGVVGLVAAGPWLHLPDMPEGAQHGLDEVLLKLGFAVALNAARLVLPHGLQLGPHFGQAVEPPEVGLLGEHVGQVVLGEQALVAERRERQLRLQHGSPPECAADRSAGRWDSRHLPQHATPPVEERQPWFAVDLTQPQARIAFRI